ncbi:MAG: PIN domain-containing protein [Balneolaceae bacterium]|nr:MAG: PIN domain-containing protein [Balneolaceae bacterium]
MNFLLDTNILVHYIRKPELLSDFETKIDAYSKHKDPERNYPKGYSSIKVGKNDLWIAATAHITNSKLVTTDDDFDHLDGVFVELVKLKL